MPSGRVVELSHSGFNGRLKLWLELERDVVQGCLAEVVGADGCAESTESVVMTASQIWADIVHPTWRALWQQRHVAVVIEYDQTGAWIHDRFRSHLPNQRNTMTCHTALSGRNVSACDVVMKMKSRNFSTIFRQATGTANQQALQWRQLCESYCQCDSQNRR